MPMTGGVYKRVTEVRRGGGVRQEELFLIWDKQTGEEKTFHYGIDAREYLRDNPEKWAATPPPGINPNLAKQIRLEEEEVFSPVILPEVGDSLLPGKQSHGETSLAGVDTKVLTRGRKAK